MHLFTYSHIVYLLLAILIGTPLGWHLCRRRKSKPETEKLEINWDNITDERIEFAYNEAIKELEDNEEMRKKLDNKTLFFLGYILIYIGGILLQYPPNATEKPDGKAAVLLILLAVNAVILVVAVLSLLHQQFTYSFRLHPKESLLDFGSTEKNRVISLKMLFLPKLQTSIDYISKKHNRRSSYFNWLTIATPLINLLIIFISVIIITVR